MTARLVRHDDGRWGVLVPDGILERIGVTNCECGQQAEVAVGDRVDDGYTDGCVCPQDPPRTWRKLVKLLRSHEFDTNRPHESVFIEGDMAFFYLSTRPPDEERTMSCVCGHAIEEHRDESKECEADVPPIVYGDSAGPAEPCPCAMYEEDEA